MSVRSVSHRCCSCTWLSIFQSFAQQSPPPELSSLPCTCRLRMPLECPSNLCEGPADSIALCSARVTPSRTRQGKHLRIPFATLVYWMSYPPYTVCAVQKCVLSATHFHVDKRMRRSGPRSFVGAQWVRVLHSPARAARFWV